jgi:hypothetical protein
MKKNVGTIDKVVRLLLALTLGVLVYLKVISGTLAYISLGLAVVFFVTSLINFCPIWMALGINTGKKKA